MKIIRGGIIAIIGALVGLAIGLSYAKVRQSPPLNKFRSRVLAIESHASQIRTGQLAVIGDSIVERQRLGRLCGIDVLNAGVSGATVSEITSHAIPAALKATPSRVIYAAGTNDFRNGAAVNLNEWSNSVRSALERLPAKPIVVGIGRLPGLELETLARANKVLADEAARRGGRFVDVASAETYDGIHLTLGGMREWQRRVGNACV